jgi:hypothetical protein
VSPEWEVDQDGGSAGGGGVDRVGGARRDGGAGGSADGNSRVGRDAGVEPDGGAGRGGEVAAVGLALCLRMMWRSQNRAAMLAPT